MKKILYGPNNGNGGNSEPFWKPWGAGGWLLRLFLFLVLMFLLILLLNLFRKPETPTNDNRMSRTEIPDPIVNPVTPDPERVPVDTTANVPHDIPNPGPYLPNPEDNNIPPIDDDEIITDDDHRQIVGDRLNIILDSSADDETFRQWAQEFHDNYSDTTKYQIVYYDRLTKLLQIMVPEEEREQIMRELPQKITDISFMVFPEGLMGNLQQHGSSGRPNDPVFEQPELAWYFDAIQAYDAWQITKGSPEVVVAICDSYFDLNHDDLNSDRIVSPYSVARRTGNVAPGDDSDPTSFLHGSMVASQALGNMDNGRGTAGIAPQCKFMPVSLGHQMTSITVLQGLLYAIYQGASVINLSVGDQYDEAVSQLSIEDQIAISQQYALEEQAVWDYTANLANERNVTIVWAAGNENVFSALDASKRGNASIKVSAVDKELHKADFSNFGNFPEYNVEESTVSAPGVDIIGAKPWNTYDIGPGTSFAAPIVTGAIALMKSLDPTLTTAEIAAILKETGRPVEGNSTIGPLLQIKDALLRVQGNFARFDDIMSNHENFVGLWQSTNLLQVTQNGQPTSDMCRQYLEITSTSAGRAIYYEATSSRQDFTAPLTIQWQQDRIVLTQADAATNPGVNGGGYVPATFTCMPDSNNLLKCQYRAENVTNDFYLRKITQRNNH